MTFLRRTGIPGASGTYQLFIWPWFWLLTSLAKLGSNVGKCLKCIFFLILSKDYSSR